MSKGTCISSWVFSSVASQTAGREWAVGAFVILVAVALLCMLVRLLVDSRAAQQKTTVTNQAKAADFASFQRSYIVSCVRGECTADGVKKEILATLMLQPLDARSGFVLYNVLALLAGVAESSIAMSLGYGWFSFVWNACVGYCFAYSLYWVFLCKQMKVRSTISIVLCADA